MIGKRRTRNQLAIVLAAALLSLYCSETSGPERQITRPFAQTAAPGGGIQLDQENGAFGYTGTMIVKGFNPTNPHVGDAIVATIFWFGAPGGVTGNIVESVTDVLTTTPFTPVGNTYTLVEFVSDGTISMATYLATNVQGFPDAGTADDEILAVKADLKVPVTNGGIAINAWIGVAATFSQALGEHRSASGLASPLTSPTIADPGAISINPGALAWGMTLGSPPAGVDGPPGWTRIGQGGDLVMKNDGEYDAQFTVSSTGGIAHPQWSWFFPATGTWLASVLALNPAPTTGNLVVTTTTSGDNVPTTDFTVTVDGSVSQTIATSGSVTFNALSPGTHSVALSDVPTNCQVTETNPANVTIVAGENAMLTFTITCSAPPSPPPPPPPPAPAPPGDFVTGGGKLGSGREFATFGLHASSSDGKFEWVQHCANGSNASSPQCAQGGFKFHGTVTPGTYAQTERGSNCRSWSGTGSSKETGAHSFTVRQACDGGEPGRGNDYIEVMIEGYENAGYLTGGNIQLHRSKS